MKFGNGCWIQKERCACFSPAQVTKTEAGQSGVTVIAPTTPILQKGDTLGGREPDDRDHGADAGRAAGQGKPLSRCGRSRSFL